MQGTPSLSAKPVFRSASAVAVDFPSRLHFYSSPVYGNLEGRSLNLERNVLANNRGEEFLGFKKRARPHNVRITDPCVAPFAIRLLMATWELVRGSVTW